MIEKGYLDCGLTGYDWILEQNVDVVEIAELRYAKEGFRPVRWVLAVPEDSPIKVLKSYRIKESLQSLSDIQKDI